jgi:uncharacterized membrane protein
MAFCPNCGAEVQGRYCAKCGTAVDQPGSSAAPPPAKASSLPDNTAAALCYVLGFITGIVFLVLEPYNRNKLIRFHAFQSIFLNVTMVIVWYALRIVLPWSAYGLIAVIDLAFFVLWIYLIIQTYQGKKIALPVLGELAAKQA